MPKLNIASGQISLNDLRTHFGDTDSISMSDFRSGGDKVVSGYGRLEHNGTIYDSNTASKTQYVIATTQTATQTNGGGTVTTSYARTVWYNGYYIADNYGTNVKSDFQSWRGVNTSHRGRIGVAMKFPTGSATGVAKRGTLQSAGSYSAWQDNLGYKDVFVNSERTKVDIYSIIVADTFNKQQVVSNVNSSVPQSGSISMDDLYEVSNGIWHTTQFTAGVEDYLSTRLGFDDDGAGNAYGSMVNTQVQNSANFLNHDPSQTYATIKKFVQTSAQSYDLTLRGSVRSVAAGSISNTSPSYISYSRFYPAINHTGLGYTNTSAVWMNPLRTGAQNTTSFRADNYNWYDYRNLNWYSSSPNTTRRDDGHAGWLLPTTGPSLLQVRAEKENSHASLTNVRFTPIASWRGRKVAIQAVRTRQSGGITGFSCSGAASGNFSGLSNTDGAPIARIITLPETGYIQFSATSTGSYSGSNRIVQINIYDPYFDGLVYDIMPVRQVYLGSTKILDTATDTYNCQHNGGQYINNATTAPLFRLTWSRASPDTALVDGQTYTLKILGN
jgi:hypothetical protein